MPQDGKTSVLINLMAIASYDGMPDYPIQFMTKGTLHYSNPDSVVLTYRETQHDDESGETIESDIILNIGEKQVTMERRGGFCSRPPLRGNLSDALRRTRDGGFSPEGRLPHRRKEGRRSPEVSAGHSGKPLFHQRAAS